MYAWQLVLKVFLLEVKLGALVADRQLRFNIYTEAKEIKSLPTKIFFILMFLFCINVNYRN